VIYGTCSMDYDFVFKYSHYIFIAIAISEQISIFAAIFFSRFCRCCN